MDDTDGFEDKISAIERRSIDVYIKRVKGIIEYIEEEKNKEGECPFFVWDFLIIDPKNKKPHDIEGFSHPEKTKKNEEKGKFLKKITKKHLDKDEYFITNVLKEMVTEDIVSFYKRNEKDEYEVFGFKRNENNNSIEDGEWKDLLNEEKAKSIDEFLGLYNGQGAFKKHEEIMDEYEVEFGEKLIFSFVPFIYNWLGKRKILFINTIAYEFKDNKNLEDFKKLYKQIYDDSQPYMYKILENVLEYNGDMFKQASIKSATAAIMSRNMSHNLGSHVMAYLKQYLYSVKDIFIKQTLVDLVTLDETDSAISKKILELVDNNGTQEKRYTEMPFLVGLGRFISYLQERQDFIATICTDYIPYFSSVNFKDFIYDELNLDLRFERHKLQLQHKGLQPHNILLNFIAKSEGLSRMNGVEMNNYNHNIVLKFCDFNGNNCDGDGKHSDLTKMRKIDFSLPGGIVGRQAFFSIVENIIRNAAKHGTRIDAQNLELTINIFEYNDIKNENTGWKNEYKNYTEIINDDLYIITVTDNLKGNGNEEIIRKLKDAINDDYIDGSGKLKDNGKGIKEMRISAAYLRSIRITEEEKYKVLAAKKEKAPILQARSDGNEEYLQYIFCVPKCKKIAFVIADSENAASIDYSNLQQVHCKLYNVTDFRKETKLNYDFIVAMDKENVYDKILPFSHSRTIIEDFNDKLSENFVSLLPLKDKEYEIKPVDEYLIELYSKLKSVKNVGKITIIDWKTKEEQKRAKKKEIEIIPDDNKVNGMLSYIYRSHHDSEDKFNDKYNFYRNIKFIESITGGNSTDRLIRQEPSLNDLWFYRHANAMNTRVAIFDERLFTKITGIEQSKLGNCWWENILDKYKNKGEEKLQDAQKELSKELQNKSYYENKATIIEELELSENFEELKEICVNYLEVEYTKEQKEPTETKDYQAIVFHQKNIDFFTCIYDDRSRSFSLWGYKSDINKVNKYIAEYICLGEIKPVEDKEALIVKNIEIKLSPNLKEYDYLSIHQGLLDKIYDKFKITDSEVKCAVTDEFHKRFIDDKYMFNENEQKNSNNKFLPRFIVHSGRSKPSNKDMPQCQPFIQYSALENAVMDCKYTLVELLDHAHYEK